jgi:hypothetical protein
MDRRLYSAMAIADPLENPAFSRTRDRIPSG